MTDLNNLRNNIDRIDDDIAKALSARLGIVQEIRKLKAQSQQQTHQPAREAEILERLQKQNPDLSAAFLQNLWRQIFSESIRQQNGKISLPVAKDGILDIKPYIGGEAKAEGAQRLIRLASNENPYGCSDKAREAYIKAAEELHRYPDGTSHELRNAIAAVHNLPAEQITCGAGSDELIALITKAFAGPGDEVLYSEHGFLMYPISARTVGAVPVTAHEQYLKADIEALLARVTERTKIVMLANPNNPTGSHLTKDEVRSFAKRLPPHIVLLLDAAYAEYAIADDYSAGYDLVAEFPNVAVLHTFSKIYGLAALRLGWCYASPHITDILNRVRGPFNVSLPAQRAGVAAIQDQQFVAHARIENAALMKLFCDDLRQMGLMVYLSQANFVLVDFGNAELAENVRLHLKNNGILVRQMPAYGLPDCLRITIGTSEDMEEVTAQIKAALVAAK